MGSKVPPIEDTKAIILKAKGAAWLAAAEQKWEKTHGTRYESALKLWLIAKQGGLDVADIKADSSGGEGTETLIVEIVEKGKTVRNDDQGKSGKGHGWTFVNGGKFDAPDQQAKYALQAVVVLSTEEGVTSTNKPKLDLVVTDGSGVSKMVAYADAVDLFTQAHAAPGAVLKVPLCNVQFGFHNFGQKPNELWWKFAVPPFGEVIPIERDVREFFLSAEEDALKEGFAVVTRGFVTHVEETEQEVCLSCNKWVTEKQTHAKCRKECEDAGKEFETEMRTFITGTGTAVNGQTHKLSFKVKPKVKIAAEEVDIFGRVNKNNGIDVSFIRKAGTESAVATERPAAKPARAAPKPARAAPKPAPVAAPEEEEPDAPEEEAPAPPPPAPKKAAPKRAPPPPAPDPEQDAGEGDEEAEEPAAAPAPPPKPAKAAVKPKLAAAAGDVPEELTAHVKKFTVNYGGRGRMFAITNAATKAKLLGEGSPDELKAKMEGYIAVLVANGTVEWTSPKKDEVKWIAG